MIKTMVKRKNDDTTVPPIPAGFEDTLKALLRTPPPPKNLGRPVKKKRKAKQGEK